MLKVKRNFFMLLTAFSIIQAALSEHAFALSELVLSNVSGFEEQLNYSLFTGTDRNTGKIIELYIPATPSKNNIFERCSNIAKEAYKNASLSFYIRTNIDISYISDLGIVTLNPKNIIYACSNLKFK